MRVATPEGGAQVCHANCNSITISLTVIEHPLLPLTGRGNLGYDKCPSGGGRDGGEYALGMMIKWFEACFGS